MIYVFKHIGNASQIVACLSGIYISLWRVSKFQTSFNVMDKKQDENTVDFS